MQKIEKIKKRNGRIVSFNKRKIVMAVLKAMEAVGEGNKEVAETIANEVVSLLKKPSKIIPTVEEVQDLVEKVLMKRGFYKAAKAYILYRALHNQIRELVDGYLYKKTWLVKENANMTFSLQGLNTHIFSEVVREYWLHRIYLKRNPEIAKAHINGDFHLHDLQILGPYCVGWDLQDLLLSGFTGVRGKITSKPAKHFRVILLQAVNFLYTLQGEAAGAQAFSNFDTFLAPFIRYDKLSYKDVKQTLQEFMFNINVPTRVGFQTPFTNITLDLKVPEFMKYQPVIIGGKVMDEEYGNFQEEMDIFNKALAEVMLEGDGIGRVFTFPIPTINVTKDFDWESEVIKKVFETSAKYGIPYFANFINSDMKPDDVRSMCCRLRISTRELKKRGGGLFGANPLTGSIGVVTINMPRIAYLSKDENEFFERLGRLMELAKESLEIKRRMLEEFIERSLYPYSKFYLRNIKQAFGKYWKNHFSTIGLIGMNEACLNFLGCSIGEKEGHKFAIKVLDFMRSKLVEFQEETGNVYNLEATPAEGSLAPEEKVLICQSDPKLVEIGPLVDQYLAKNKEKVRKFGTSEVLKLPEGEMFTYGFSRKNGKIKKYPVTALVRHKGRSMYEVETFSGRKVRVTGQHSLFTLNERGEIEEILVRGLRKNTPIAIPKNLEMEKIHKEFNLFKSFQNSSLKAFLYIILPEEFVKSLLNVEKVRRWAENHYNFSFKDVKYMWKKSKTLPLKLFYDLGINLSRKILKDSKIFYRKTKNTKPINVFLPINHDLGFIIGVILSEGWVGDQIQISNIDRELIEATKRKSEKIFGSKVASISVLKKRGNRKRKYILTFSKMASIVLKHVVGLEGKSDEKKVPSFIFFSPKRAVQGVLKGFSLGDGSFYINKEKGDYSFRLYTNSSDLANHLNILLLRLGILSKIRKEKKHNPKWKDNYVLSITGIENLRKFFKFVLEEPLSIKGKEKNSEKEVLSFNLDLIKSIMKKHSIKPEDIGIRKDSFNRNVRNKRITLHFLRRIVRRLCAKVEDLVLEKIKILIKCDIYWDKVKKIKKLNVPRYVYDLEVDVQGDMVNNFLGGMGLVCLHNTSYRLARIDKSKYSDIIVANEKDVKEKRAAPYYTNSTWLPVYYTDNLWELLRLQDPLQIRYTGGTVVHIWLGERAIAEGVMALVRKVFENFRLPYISITPTFSICPIHGYIAGEHPKCPICGRKTEIYSRIVGYLRPVDQYNPGKQAEFRQRKMFDKAFVSS